MCTSTCARVCCARRDHRSTLNGIPQKPCTLFFETRSLIRLELTNEASLTSQQAPGSHLFLSPSCFRQVQGIELGSLCLHGKHFTTQAISPSALCVQPSHSNTSLPWGLSQRVTRHAAGRMCLSSSEGDAVTGEAILTEDNCCHIC